MKKRIFFAALASVLLIVLWNCNKDEDDNGVKSYTGEWIGTTSDGNEVYIRVNDDQEIDSLLIYVTVDLGSSSCSGLFLYKTTSSENAVISGGSFEIEAAGVQMGFSGAEVAVISGNFSSYSHCSGNFDGIDVGAIVCGGYFTIGTGMEIEPFTWTADKN